MLNPVKMSLDEQQQALLRVLRGDTRLPQTESGLTDPWLTEVLHSPGLAMVREIAAWWLRFQIESQCRLTSRLMKRMGCFETYLAAHAGENTIPPAIEELTRQFLSSLASHPDPLLRAVATLELTCLAPADPSRHITTHWDRDPNAVLISLSHLTELPPPELGVQYILTLDPGPPADIYCTRETAIILA